MSFKVAQIFLPRCVFFSRAYWITWSEEEGVGAGGSSGVWDLYIIAPGLLSEFVIQPSVYFTMKQSTFS